MSNDYGQLAFREDYRLGLRHLRDRLAKRHKTDQVRCIFEEVKASVDLILSKSSRETASLAEYEVDALILFKGWIKREGRCRQT